MFLHLVGDICVSGVADRANGNDGIAHDVIEAPRRSWLRSGGLMRWLLVDVIDTLETGVQATGRKTWHEGEAFFEDHFPSFPVVPGVLLMEALAQLAGKLIGYTVRQERGDWPFPILSMMNGVKFRKFVPYRQVPKISKHGVHAGLRNHEVIFDRSGNVFDLCDSLVHFDA